MFQILAALILLLTPVNQQEVAPKVLDLGLGKAILACDRSAIAVSPNEKAIATYILNDNKAEITVLSLESGKRLASINLQDPGISTSSPAIPLALSDKYLAYYDAGKLVLFDILSEKRFREFDRIGLKEIYSGFILIQDRKLASVVTCQDMVSVVTVENWIEFNHKTTITNSKLDRIDDVFICPVGENEIVYSSKSNLYHFDLKSNQVDKIAHSGSRIRSIALLRKDRYWLGCDDGSMYAFDANLAPQVSTFKISDFTLSNIEYIRSIRAVAVSSLENKKNLAVYSADGMRKICHLSTVDTIITSMKSTSNGHLYCISSDMRLLDYNLSSIHDK